MITDFLKGWYKKLLRLSPYVRFLEERYCNLRMISSELGHEPGHFYSTIPSIHDVNRGYERVKGSNLIQNIDLNLYNQRRFLENWKEYYAEYPYHDSNSLSYKLLYPNEGLYYRFGDVMVMYFIFREFCPLNVIEIGSGHSSAAMLDFNNLFFNNNIEFHFVEPFPENRLKQILGKANKAKFRIYEQLVQDLDLSFFKELGENDILFVDSSHVSKIGSDLNFILFNVLPILNPGVLIHFHDIFYPFELPELWVRKHKRYWNENYLIRAFLMHNHDYEIVMFNSLLFYTDCDWLMKNMPYMLKESEEIGSLWIRKLR